MRPFSYTSCMKCRADLTKEGKQRRRCSGCHSVFYDDVACQKSDWAVHKTECKELQRRFLTTVQVDYPDVDSMATLLARPDMCRVIALRYLEGDDGFEQNDCLAEFWIRQWMKSGDVAAMYTLGMCYTSEGVPGKCKEGVMLLQRVCEKSDCPEMAPAKVEAQYLIGECCCLGRGTDSDTSAAAKWYRLAAKEGHALAQYRLGRLLACGDGVEKNEEEALKWYRKAAAQGNTKAQIKAGLLLLLWAAGVANDPRYTFSPIYEERRREAVSWFRKGADRRSATAQYHLGLCYAGGTGVALDRDEAIRLFRLSADQGNEKAKAEL
eukprot:TRINITY_DN139_c1_g1_i2.p1 TRINITY_DN139_c1_g1~~TRINITY_DN139_c1_g1_i2.p1  ORF type:complete len:323 (-),score=79.73 TRINITY_DN139_c1_g1_i2:102-1070(-)